MFQSTRPTRGATCTRLPDYSSHDVSIHAPHAGRDVGDQLDCRRCAGFNPRAPRGARLASGAELLKAMTGFQSTRPTRGATTPPVGRSWVADRKSTRLNSSHANISYAVF